MEIYAHAKELVSLLRLGFAIPTGSRPPLDDPDTLLIASIVLVTKLLYPMDGVVRSPMTDDDPTCLRVNWEKWQDIFADQMESEPASRDFDLLTSKDVSSMSGEEMDQYLEWYRKVRLTPQEGW